MDGDKGVNFSKDFSDYKYPHYCKYEVMRSSVSVTPLGSRWVERCRCGYTVSVDCSTSPLDSKSPKQTRTWFNDNGDIIRKTGVTDVDVAGK